MTAEGDVDDVDDENLLEHIPAAIRFIQERSARELAVRRAEVVAAIQSALAQRGAPGLEFVNGGGTGSLERTAAEDAVTEVAAGSGLYAPTLFDAYSAFTPQPAALFALPVVRRPSPGVVTALGLKVQRAFQIITDALPT